MALSVLHSPPRVRVTSPLSYFDAEITTVSPRNVIYLIQVSNYTIPIGMTSVSAIPRPQQMHVLIICTLHGAISIATLFSSRLAYLLSEIYSIFIIICLSTYFHVPLLTFLFTFYRGAEWERRERTVRG